jgi:molybdopterin converting factor subunit 1
MTVKRQIRIKYYAVLRERAGRHEETLATAAADASELYEELRTRYAFHLPQSQLKVAINAEFADWSRRLIEGDEVVFIPPVAGG